MLILKVGLHAMRDGERASGTLSIDQKKGDSWTRIRNIDLVSGTPGAEQTVPLESGQRISFEGSSNVEIVYDRVQNAAVPRPKLAPQRPAGAEEDEYSPEKPLADIAAEQFEEQKRQAALQKVREERAAQEAVIRKEAQQAQQAALDAQKTGSEVTKVGAESYGQADAPKAQEVPSGFPAPKPKAAPQ